VTYVVSECCGSAMQWVAVLLCSSATWRASNATPVQTITASFWAPTASFGCGCIYTHPPLELRLTSRPSKTHPKPFESSPQPSLCEWSSKWVIWGERLSKREQTKPWALVGLRRSFVAHLLLLEVKPPRWLGIAQRASVLVVSMTKFVFVQDLSGNLELITLVVS
jgi:hypothetical protein